MHVDTSDCHCGALTGVMVLDSETGRSNAIFARFHGMLSVDRIDNCPLRHAMDQHETMCKEFSPEKGRRIEP